MMPSRVEWGLHFAVGHEVLDEQHRQLAALCNVLADQCAVDGGNSGADPEFRRVYERAMNMAREHFAAEEALLVAGGYPEIEDYRCEIEEYEYLATEIATTENFDKIELQRFLALWWVGHILDAAKRQSPYLTDSPTAA